MIKITIKSDLEKRLRASHEPLAVEICGLIDRAKDRIRAPQEHLGVGYKDLVALFRAELGVDLALPPNPSTGWIIKVVNRAREQGVGADNVPQICKGVRKAYPRGPYALDFVVNFATRAAVIAGASDAGVSTRPDVVVTGRGGFNEE